MTQDILPEARQEVKAYRVKKINEELNIASTRNNPLWETAPALTDFVYPWEACKAACTTFKALHSEHWLYCRFTVRADDVNVFSKTNDKSEILKSDRVEIFFKQNDLMSPYYCIEIDPLARIYDYEAWYHRRFNTDWSWPLLQLVTHAKREASGYTVELALHKDSLRDLGILKDHRIAAGLFRAECAAIRGDEADMRWISWVKPDSSAPDFHIPSSFGILDFEQ